MPLFLAGTLIKARSVNRSIVAFAKSISSFPNFLLKLLSP